MYKHEKAYVAGLIDGEGSILLSKKNTKSPWRTPVISISSTTYEILKFLKEKYGGTICSHKTYEEHHRKHWSWRLAYRKALLFCRDIYPFLLEPRKKYRCWLLLNVYPEVTNRGGHYNPQLAEKKEMFEKSFFSEEVEKIFTELVNGGGGTGDLEFSFEPGLCLHPAKAGEMRIMVKNHPSNSYEENPT